jgi:hypothetical protein
MALLQQYAAASQEIANGVMARSEAMAPLQSEGYFYHGMDGAPIGKSALNQRQLRNGLVIERSEILNGHLYQYEDTAIAAYHTRQSGEDRGRRFDDLMTSNLIVMGKVDGEWKVLSDIIGAEPSPPEQRSSAPLTQWWCKGATWRGSIHQRRKARTAASL